MTLEKLVTIMGQAYGAVIEVIWLNDVVNVIEALKLNYDLCLCWHTLQKREQEIIVNNLSAYYVKNA